MKLMTGNWKGNLVAFLFILSVGGVFFLQFQSAKREQLYAQVELSLQVHEYYWMPKEVRINGEDVLQELLIVDITVVNRSDLTVVLGPWHLVDSKGQHFEEYRDSLSREIKKRNMSYIRAPLPPDGELRGIVVFIIPEDHLPLRLSCRNYISEVEIPELQQE